jgi:hypothetical protein
MADEAKTTSKTSAKKDKAEDLSAADLELSGPVVGGTVKGTPPEATEEVPDETPVVVTVAGEEVVIPPDLRGRILTESAALAAHAEHPSNLSPAYSNTPNRAMTEEEAKADNEEFAGRFG